jgi:hypothetical protein
MLGRFHASKTMQGALFFCKLFVVETKKPAVNSFSTGSKKPDEFFLQPCKDDPHAQSKRLAVPQTFPIFGFAGGPFKKTKL